MRFSDIRKTGAAFWRREEQLGLPLSESYEFGCYDPPFSPSCLSTGELLQHYLDALGLEQSAKISTVLLNEFQTIPNMLSASSWRLRKVVGGRTAKAIRATGALLQASHLERMAAKPIIRNSEATLAFLQSQSGYLAHERITALYIGQGLRLLKVQVLAEGDVGYTDFSLSTVLRWGLDVGASAFILVHNHPSGDPTPSQTDKAVTARMQRMANALEMPMLEHIIVAKGRVAYVNMEPKD